MGSRVLAIIPARKGSKRLPRKNIIEVGGKPLIQWTIEAAKSAGNITDIVVTSDDECVLGIAKRLNVFAINRPSELATDTASTVDVVLHALSQVALDYDYIILLQPTSPMRRAEHISQALDIMHSKKCNAVISVKKLNHSPLWANKLPLDGSLKGFLKEEVKGKRSQDLDDFYILNGAIYIIKVDLFKREKTFFIEDDSYAFFMDEIDSLDIDTKDDMDFFEFIIERKLKNDTYNS